MKIRTLAARVLPLALLLVASTATLFGVLRRPATLDLDLADVRASRFLDQFAAPESGDGRTFRWSTPGSRLIFHRAGDGPQLLELHIHGAVRAQGADHNIRIEREKQPIATFPIRRPEWRPYQVLLPAGTTSGAGTDAAPLDFLTASYYSDLRSLGVPIERVELVPLATESAPWLPLL